MAKTTAPVQMDTWACDAGTCEVAHQVRPGERPPGYLVEVSALTLGELAATAYADQDDAREVYACKQGCIGRAVAGRVKALQEAAAAASTANERPATADEEAAREDGYDGPMPDGADAGDYEAGDVDRDGRDDEDDADEDGRDDGDAWDAEMRAERAAAGAAT